MSCRLHTAFPIINFLSLIGCRGTRCFIFGISTVDVLSKTEIESVYCVIFRRARKISEKRLLASSYPSVRVEQLGSQWTDFNEI